MSTSYLFFNPDLRQSQLQKPRIPKRTLAIQIKKEDFRVEALLSHLQH